MKQKYIRQCGGCTACCTTHEVREIHKPVGQQCQFCSEGVGCKVYEHRPKGCRDFVCEWIKGFGPEDSRPDRSGIVADLQNPVLETVLLTIWEYQAGALESNFVSELINHTLASGRPVLCLFLSGEKRLFVSSSIELSRQYRRLLEAKKVGVVLI